MRRLTIAFFFFLGFGRAEAAPVQVVTTLNELAWATQEIGGANVVAKALLEGTENPHFVDAVPEFIRLTANASAVFIAGLDLEIGWMPKVLGRSGNAQVQPGGKGYAELGRYIQVLEKPPGQGNPPMTDVHPTGNPHFWMSPKEMMAAAGAITDTLSAVDPSHAAEFTKGRDAFRKKLGDIASQNQAKVPPTLTNSATPWVIEYHREFSYFFGQYGLKSFGAIEEKPGIPPSAGRIAQVALAAKQAGVRVALAADYASKKTLDRFSEISGIPVLQVPTSIQPKGAHKDYAELQAFLLDSVLKYAPGKAH